MSGISKWLRTKLTRTTSDSAKPLAHAPLSWMDDPAYACALTLPYGQMSEIDVDRTFRRLTKWAAYKDPDLAPNKREDLTVHIDSSPIATHQLPDGFHFMELNGELAHWLVVSFPSLRKLILFVFERDNSNAVSGVLLAPKCDWCRQLTKLDMAFDDTELAWVAFARLEECTALKKLFFSCNKTLCPPPMATLDASDGGGGEKLINTEGPRQTLVMPWLVRLALFEIRSYTDDLSSLWYSLRSFVPPDDHKQRLWLGIFVRKLEFDGFLAELPTVSRVLPSRIHKIGVELPPWDAAKSLNDLVELLHNLRFLRIRTTELSLLAIMRTLRHSSLKELYALSLELGSPAQLPDYAADGVMFQRKMKQITHLYLIFNQAEHDSFHTAPIEELFPKAEISAAWYKCATCGISSTNLSPSKGAISNICWYEVLVGDGVTQFAHSFQQHY